MTVRIGLKSPYATWNPLDLLPILYSVKSPHSILSVPFRKDKMEISLKYLVEYINAIYPIDDLTGIYLPYLPTSRTSPRRYYTVLYCK